MKEKNIWFSTCIAVILSLVALAVYYFNTTTKNKNFECDATIMLVNNESGVTEISSNFLINLMSDADYFTITGELTLNGKEYIIHRDIFFITNEESPSLTTITKNVILPGDNITTDIFEKYISPRPLGVPFHMETKKLVGNLYSLNMPSSPILICASR